MLQSPCNIHILKMFSVCIDAPKGPSYYPISFTDIIASNMSYVLQCAIKKDKLQGPNLVLTPHKSLGQGLYYTPKVSCSKFLPKILLYFSKLKMHKLTIISWAII